MNEFLLSLIDIGGLVGCALLAGACVGFTADSDSYDSYDSYDSPIVKIFGVVGFVLVALFTAANL